MTAPSDCENDPEEVVYRAGEERCPAAVNQQVSDGRWPPWEGPVELAGWPGTRADGWDGLLAKNAFPKSRGEAWVIPRPAASEQGKGLRAELLF